MLAKSKLALALPIVLAAVTSDGYAVGGEPPGKPVKGDAGNSPAKVKGNYADVNGLRMYYEIHGNGAGVPLVLLHGSFGTIEGWGGVLSTLAESRRVIAIELQGHGHSGDLDQPLTFEQMADDTAAMLQVLKINRADLFGYSMGGVVGLGVAIRHPELVRKLVINGSHYGQMSVAYDPGLFKHFNTLSADFAPPQLKGPYDKVAPDPKQWPTLVAKIKELNLEFKGFTGADLKAIKAHVLITIGDRDAVRPEHSVEMYRLIPNSQLAVLPGADHFLLLRKPEELLPMIITFLDAPVQSGQ